MHHYAVAHRVYHGEKNETESTQVRQAGDITGYVYEMLSRVSNICHVLTGCPIKRSGSAHGSFQS